MYVHVNINIKYLKFFPSSPFFSSFLLPIVYFIKFFGVQHAFRQRQMAEREKKCVKECVVTENRNEQAIIPKAMYR